MLKNKEIRDNALLIGMAIITITFLVYLFFPFGGDSPPDKAKDNPTVDPDGKPTTAPIKVITVTHENKDSEKLVQFEKNLEKELVDIYLTILSSPTPFETFLIDKLKTILEDNQTQLYRKYLKFSFLDLGQIINFELPPEYSNELKFNIYLAMFLIKVQDEQILERFRDLTQVEFENNMPLNIYSLLGNQLEKEYQVIPYLFYFKLLLDRIDLFPSQDNTSFFRKKVNQVIDLSYNKHLNKIKELLNFSSESIRFRILWVEEDGIGSDDKKTYSNISLPTFHFFKQTYLVFPERDNPANNQWLNDLCSADSGDIELEELQIRSEDPAQGLKLNKIYYNPINSQFIVVLIKNTGIDNNIFLNRLWLRKSRLFQKNYTIIDFSGPASKDESFKNTLENFGDYLKQNRVH